MTPLDAGTIAQWLKECSGGDEWNVMVSHSGMCVTVEPKAPMNDGKYRDVIAELLYRRPPECTIIAAGEQRKP